MHDCLIFVQNRRCLSTFAQGGRTVLTGVMDISLTARFCQVESSLERTSFDILSYSILIDY